MVSFKRNKAEGAAKRGQGKSKGGGVSRGQRFVIILGDEGAILVYVHGKKVERRLFAPSAQPDHTAGMIELMRAHPRAPVYILADVIDQQYVRHTFPPVSSFSVAGLVKRRMERDFQAEDLKGSLQLGREKGGRREWNYLLIALANTPMLQQWLDVVVELPNELKGIYLAPVEAQNYIADIKRYVGGAPVSWQLLVSHNKVSGFRQVVLRDGKLVFTRVTQAIDDALAAVIAGNIEQEILNTIEYLRRTGFSDNANMEIMVIAAQEVKEVLDLKRFNVAGNYALTPLEVGDALQLEQAALSADRFGDVVMAAAFGATRKHVLRFFTAYGQQLAQLYQIRRAMTALVALLLLGLGYMAAGNVVAMVGSNGQASDLEAQRKPVQDQLTAVRRSIDGLDKDVAFKSAVVATYDAYFNQAQSPLEFIEQLAPLMPKDVRVLTFKWQPAAAQQASGGGAPNATSTEYEIVTEIEFTGTYADAEALSKSADQFIDMLISKLPAYSVSHSAYPWASDAEQSLEISFDQEQQAGLPEGNTKVTLTFVGPKTTAPAAGQGVIVGPGGVNMMGMP